MNCKPGDLARVIDTPAMRKMGFVDKVLKLTTIIGETYAGNPAWGYEGPLLTCQCGCGEYADGIGDNVLRPIRDPGDDAQDETLQWLPVPTTEGVPA